MNSWLYILIKHPTSHLISIMIIYMQGRSFINVIFKFLQRNVLNGYFLKDWTKNPTFLHIINDKNQSKNIRIWKFSFWSGNCYFFRSFLPINDNQDYWHDNQLIIITRGNDEKSPQWLWITVDILLPLLQNRNDFFC